MRPSNHRAQLNSGKTSVLDKPLESTSNVGIFLHAQARVLGKPSESIMFLHVQTCVLGKSSESSSNVCVFLHVQY